MSEPKHIYEPVVARRDLFRFALFVVAVAALATLAVVPLIYVVLKLIGFEFWSLWGFPPPNTIGHISISVAPPTPAWESLLNDAVNQIGWLPYFAVLSIPAAIALTRATIADHKISLRWIAFVAAFPGLALAVTVAVPNISQLPQVAGFLSALLINLALPVVVAAAIVAHLVGRRTPPSPL